EHLPRGQGWPAAGLRRHAEVPGRPALARSHPVLRILPRRQRGRPGRQPSNRLDRRHRPRHASVCDDHGRANTPCGHEGRRDRGAKAAQRRFGGRWPGEMSREDGRAALESEPLDFVPLWILFLAGCLFAWLALEGGYRLGKWRHARAAEEKETPVGAMVASILGLLAFLLAFTFGLAATRYDARRQTV